MTIEYERNTDLIWREDTVPSVKHPTTITVSHHGNSGDVYIHRKDRDGEVDSLILTEHEWHALSVLLQEVSK